MFLFWDHACWLGPKQNTPNIYHKQMNNGVHIWQTKREHFIHNLPRDLRALLIMYKVLHVSCARHSSPPCTCSVTFPASYLSHAMLSVKCQDDTWTKAGISLQSAVHLQNFCKKIVTATIECSIDEWKIRFVEGTCFKSHTGTRYNNIDSIRLPLSPLEQGWVGVKIDCLPTWVGRYC